MIACPQCDTELRLVYVAANGSGNDTIQQCPNCGEWIEKHEPYRHRWDLNPTWPAPSLQERPLAEPEGPNPAGLCLCGCGKRAPVARDNDRRKGHVKGKPMRYIHGHGGHALQTRLSGSKPRVGRKAP